MCCITGTGAVQGNVLLNLINSKFMKKTAIIILLVFTIQYSFAQQWDTLAGMSANSNGTIAGFAVHDGVLYVSGGLYGSSPLGPQNLRVAMWDSVQWHGLPTTNSLSGAPEAMCWWNNTFFIAGNFHVWQPGSSFHYLGMLVNNTWQQVGAIGSPSSEVFDLCEYNDKLYVAGDYYHIGTNELNTLVSWNGSTLEQVEGIDMFCRSIVVYNNELVACGSYGVVYTETGTDNCIGSYDGQHWNSMLTNADVAGYFNSLVVDTMNNELFVAGDCYFNIDGQVSGAVARWDGEKWYPLTNDITYGGVYRKAICFYHKELYIGGDIDTIDGQSYHYLARWDGEDFHTVAGGVNHEVFVLKSYKDQLYVGGAFDTVGGYLQASGIARYYAPPPTGCKWFRPRIQTAGYQDTFYITQSQPYVFVDFVNNNAYAESWEWNFGDGFNGSGSKDIEHGYYQPGEYTVQVEVTQEGCTKTAEKLIVIEDHTGGIAKKAGAGAISVYPNPGSGQVVVKTNNGSAIGSIRISSTEGKQMYIAEINSSEISINTGDWPAGTYLVECREHGVVKLVVE